MSSNHRRYSICLRSQFQTSGEKNCPLYRGKSVRLMLMSYLKSRIREKIVNLITQEKVVNREILQNLFYMYGDSPLDVSCLKNIEHYCNDEAIRNINKHNQFPPELLEKTDIYKIIKKDPFPIPLPEHREYIFVGDDSEPPDYFHLDYWLSGYFCYLEAKEKFNSYSTLEPLGPNTVLLDFGCNSGITIRHFNTHENMKNLFGCDVKDVNLNFIRKYLSKDIKVITNSILPFLPYPENFFDFIISYSVFTHLTYGVEHWLLELKRILKPGGVLYVTILSELSLEKILMGNTGNENMYVEGELEHIRDWLSKNGFYFRRPKVDVSYDPSSIAYISHKYAKEVWGAYFEEVKVFERQHFQDVVILRK